MTLLFITQKLSGQDTFTVLWIRAFIRRGYVVKVICLEGQERQEGFTVYSLGKETGTPRLLQIFRFWKLIMSLRYDRVFIHMSPVWYTLGWKWWLLRGTPVYLWYTHYKMQLGVWLFGMFGRRFFCATAQSLPQYPSASSGQAGAKKVVTGHGIDLQQWPMQENVANDPYRLLMVHRLSRSKRVELSLHALTLLPREYTLDIYGIEAEHDYVTELDDLMKKLHLQMRVRFHGTIPMDQLASLYTQHRLILNMASETIDKTMLEAMTCGCYPITTNRNAAAIGIPASPREDTPESIARFIEEWKEKVPMSAEEMYRVVEEKHSLAGLVEKMDAYIRPGN